MVLEITQNFLKTSEELLNKSMPLLRVSMSLKRFQGYSMRTKSKQLGKILWWSSRDENGVISDSQGNEYYFDRSIISSKQMTKLERGTLVLFETGRCDSVPVAKAISIPTPKSVSKYEEKFQMEKRQLSLPLAI